MQNNAMGTNNSTKPNLSNIKKLIKQQYIGQQNSLCLNNCYSEWEAILKQQDWSSLSQLSLSNCKIVSDKLSQLLNYKFQNLTKLQLFRNNIGSTGIKILTKIYLPNLSSLNISTCNIGDSGAKILCNANWKDLQQLYLCGNYIIFYGFQELYHGQWENLQYVRLTMPFINIEMDSLSVLNSIKLQTSYCKFQMKIKNSFLQNKVDSLFRKRFVKKSQENM